ncbi:MAG: class I SAM-dependent methyltransferase [Actinomycetota bacterium]
MGPGELWSLGDYGIVGDLWAAVGRDLAHTIDVVDRDVIDLATGTGVTAIALARRGARTVVGVDAAAPLLREAARRAARGGIRVRWIEADFSSVPLDDRSADVAVSTFGLIFAADPAAAFAECRRLVRPGGEIIFTSWSASGLFGRIREVMAPYFPDVPEPWHEQPDRIRAVVGDGAVVEERSFVLTVDSAEEFVSQLERHNAPFVAAVGALGDRWTDARADLVDAVRAAGTDGAGSYRAEVPYLVTTMRVLAAE